MIKILLLLFLLLIALYVWLQRATSMIVRVVIGAILMLGGYFVIAPQQATEIAKVLGVGRGADLVMYLWIVVTFSVILVLYLKLVVMSRTITQLARSLALSQARYPDDDAGLPPPASPRP
jgi:small membrane protein